MADIDNDVPGALQLENGAGDPFSSGVVAGQNAFSFLEGVAVDIWRYRSFL